MTKLLSVILILMVLLVSSCHKCYNCTQYCAYCTDTAQAGINYKFCASKDVTQGKIDSIYFAMKGAGYDCILLDEEKRACDRPSKLNEAVDYYELQDYYCSPQ